MPIYRLNAGTHSSDIDAAFTVIQTDTGTSPVATGPMDTLTLTSSDGSVLIDGDATTDTVDFTIDAGSIETGVLPIAHGGTNSSAALNDNRVMISSGDAIVEAAAITANRAVVSDANGIPISATTTAAEIDFVNGVVSSIQDQLDAKEPAITPGDISTSTTGVSIGSGIASTVGPNVTVNVQTANTSQPGLLSSSDWNTFNGKQNALTIGNLTSPTTGVSIGGGTGAVIGSGSTVSVQTASGSQPGLLSASDWTTFNSKQAAGNYITALTGEVTASGPGSVAATVTNSAVIGKVITGYVSGSGTVAATDTILQAVNKLNGNDALKAPLASPSFTGTVNIASLTASQAVVTDGSKNLASLAYTNANTVSTIVSRDSSGNFSAGTITAAVTGTASGNTTLASPSNHGVVLSGSANALSALAPNASTSTILVSGGASADPSWALLSNASIASGAAIAYSKLAALTSANILVGNVSNVATATAVTGDVTIDNAGVTAIASGVIVNADINASAAIAFSKLATLSSANILVGSSGNVATSTAVTGDVTINNSGVTAITSGVIVNADINASAAIAYSKLAALSSGNVLVGSGGSVATSVAVSGDLTAANTGAFTVAKIQANTVSGTTGTTKVVFSDSPILSGSVEVSGVGTVITPKYYASGNTLTFSTANNDAFSIDGTGLVHILGTTTLGNQLIPFIDGTQNNALIATNTDIAHLSYIDNVTSDIQTQINSKQATLTPGNISTSTTGVSVGSGTASTVGPSVTVNVQTASTSQPGLISSTDWNTFNNKAPTASPTFTGTTTDANLTVTGTAGVGTAATATDNLKVAGTQPVSVGTATGTNGMSGLNMVGSQGGNTSIATTGTGGQGGGSIIQGGAGGNPTAATTSATGGQGGFFRGFGGAGGSVTVAGTLNTGGNGGAGTITAGAGGNASGSASNVGGTGGTATLNGGAGGTGDSGGTGGNATINGGAAGATVAAAGGAVAITAAAGSGTGSGGNGGNALVTAGAAGGDNTVSRNGGAVTLTAGVSKGNGTGGAINANSGAGGTGIGTGGGNGGAINVTAGAGGVGSATGGTGGNVVISAGLGGASGTPGVGGAISFRTAATTGITTQFTIDKDGIGSYVGDFKLTTLGKKYFVKEGTNAAMGTVALVLGVATVSTTAVTANSRIFLTSQADGGTVGFLRVTAKTAATSFVITSSNLLDTSTVAWVIIEAN